MEHMLGAAGAAGKQLPLTEESADNVGDFKLRPGRTPKPCQELAGTARNVQSSNTLTEVAENSVFFARLARIRSEKTLRGNRG